MLHNIYIDGSFLDNNSGIGIYDSYNNNRLFFKINGLTSSVETEKEALKYALDYVKKGNIKNFNILTDCKYIVEKFRKVLSNNKYFNDLKWIPREENAIADELATLGRLTTNDYLIKTPFNDELFFKEKTIFNSYNFYIEDNCLIKEENIIDKTFKKNKSYIVKNSIFLNNNLVNEIKEKYNFYDKIFLLKQLIKNEKEELIIDCLENNINIEIFSDGFDYLNNILFIFAFTIINKNERNENFNNFIKKYNCSKQINQKDLLNLLKNL